jgi:hypothetical protein
MRLLGQAPSTQPLDIEYIPVNSINPDFIKTWSPLSYVTQCVNFEANCFSKRQDNLTYEWFFDKFPDKHQHGQKATLNYDDLFSEASDNSITLNVTLSVTDSHDNFTENITRKEIISLIPRNTLLCGANIQPVSFETEADLTYTPENENGVEVLIKVAQSAPKPVAGLIINFDNATSNIDMTSLTAGMDLTNRKSFFHMPNWPTVVEQSKTLYIPCTGVGTVYICPGATSLSDVSPLNAQYFINVGETLNGISVDTAIYDDQLYYVVAGLTGTGGGEADPPVVSTLPATNITLNSVQLRGNLTSRGTAPSDNVCFIWGTSQDGPYLNETPVQQMNSTGIFNAPISGLAAQTTYYYKAVASGHGTSYGEEKSFTTLLPPTPIPTPPILPNPLIGTGAPTSHGSSVAGTTTTTQPVSLPNIQIQSASLSAYKVAPGTPVTVTANIANRGTGNGSIRLKLYVNGEEDSSQGITVESGGNRPVYFTVSRNQPGIYAVYIGGTQAGSFMVEDAIDPNAILYISLSLIFFALVLGMIMIVRRKSHY